MLHDHDETTRNDIAPWHDLMASRSKLRETPEAQERSALLLQLASAPAEGEGGGGNEINAAENQRKAPKM